MLSKSLERRRFLKGLGAFVAAGFSPPSFSQAPFRFSAVHDTRSLAMLHLHTGERCQSCFWQHGRYDVTGLRRLDKLLRDFRRDEMIPMDRLLYQQLYWLQLLHGKPIEFDIISGYRSPATNEELRRKSSGVARNSFHMSGRAIDIRTPDLQVSELHTLALNLNAGGVGYYPRSGFVHLDTGPVRRWQG
jgi:uncharacterized protein YcbK (DUF882 family)